MVDNKKKPVDYDEIIDGEIIGEYGSETFLNLPKVPDADDIAAAKAASVKADNSRRDFMLRLLVGGASALALGGSGALWINQQQKNANRTEVILPYGTNPSPDQPANMAELMQRIAALEYDLAAMTAARDQAISDLNVSATEVNELRAQLDAALAQLTDAQGVNALWQALDDVGLDNIVATALAVVGGALVGAMEVLAVAQTGLVAAQTAIQKFLASIPGPRDGIRWLSERVTALSNDLDWLAQQVQEAVQPAQSFTSLIAQFVIWVLDRLPFGVGDDAKAGLEAMQSVINTLPDTISGIEDDVLNPLADWFSNSNTKSISAILIDPVQQRGINTANDLVNEVNTFKTSYDENFAVPAQAALAKRAEIRSEIQAAMARLTQKS